jgi:uncharacterized protein (DUF342 family)
MLVRAPNLGATAGGLTQVHVGVNPAFMARYRELDHDIEHEHVEADKLEKVAHHLQAHGDPRHLLAKVKAAWQQELQAWGHLLEEKAELDHQLALTHGARIEFTAALGGDVDIAFGKVARRVRTAYGAGAFSVDDQGRVVYSTPDGKAAAVI